MRGLYVKICSYSGLFLFIKPPCAHVCLFIKIFGDHMLHQIAILSSCKCWFWWTFKWQFWVPWGSQYKQSISHKTKSLLIIAARKVFKALYLITMTHDDRWNPRFIIFIKAILHISKYHQMESFVFFEKKIFIFTISFLKELKRVYSFEIEWLSYLLWIF